MERSQLQEMDHELEQIRAATERLRAMAATHGMPAAEKNAERMMACIEMLTLHISDPLKLIEE